jgi:hypothetical protein
MSDSIVVDTIGLIAILRNTPVRLLDDCAVVNADVRAVDIPSPVF